MNKIYIIYDNTNSIWNKGYTSFELALIEVLKKVNTINEEYKQSEQYQIEPALPANMEDDYDKAKTNSGVMVANIYDYDIQIYIKCIIID